MHTVKYLTKCSARAIIVFLVMLKAAFGHSFIQEKVIDSFRRADAVFDVKIAKVTEVKNVEYLCGYRYEGILLHKRKGRAGHVVTFGYMGELEAGKSYRLYVNNSKDDARFIGFVSSLTTDGKFKEEFLKNCSALLENRYFFRSDRLDKK